MVNADIHNDNISACVTRKHIYPGAAPQKIKYHLLRNFFWICRNPFFGYAVVTGKGKDDFFIKYRFFIFCYGDKFSCKLLEPSKAAERFCEVVKMFLRNVIPLSVYRL